MHRNKHVKKHSILSIVTFSLLISGCGFIQTPDKVVQNAESTGSIRINLVEMVNAKIHLPDINMDVALYDVVGEGPGKAAFEAYDLYESTYINNSVPFGKWDIQVFGKNSEGIIIGSGQAEAAVSANEISVIDIAIIPLGGTGTLNLTINWNIEDLFIPSVEAELISSSGVSRDLDFTITGGNQGTCSLSGIMAGYYILTAKLLDNGIVTMGAVEMVRIASDQTTAGSYDFYLLNKPEGTIEVNIDQEMADPIEVSMSGLKPSITTAEEMTVSASVRQDDGPVVFVWYINGGSVKAGETFRINGLDEGFYRLDVTVFSVDGSKGGSETFTFEIKDSG
jgi:hypothetical protein